MPATCIKHQPSTRDNSTSMAPIDDAIAAIDARDSEDDSTLTEIADKFGVDRSTLGRKCKGTTTTQEAGYALQQKLNPQQESEPVAYIEELTKRALPPTRAMIRNFASEVAKERVSESWVTQFLNHNKDNLVSKWTTSMDRNRHQADSGFKYKLYFDLLHHKMEEYDVKPRNTYNMDKKGFLIGVASRSKRVFTRRQWKKKEVRASLQDGSREWITLLATVCADGKVLPPGLIYQSTNSTSNQPGLTLSTPENTRSLSPHLPRVGAIMTLDWHGSSRFLIAVQRQRHGDCTGCSSSTAMAATSL
jgi:hypothetical protein